MKNFIYPCLTIRGKITEAAEFYTQTFGEGKIGTTHPFVIQIELSGQKFMLLNEGPSTDPNPAISFMVLGENAEETEKYWNKLQDGGKIMMPLDSYPWSTKYGWIEDKYGVSWQLYTGTKEDVPQKFCPTLMFTGDRAGKAETAINFYTSLFPNSVIQGIQKYAEGEGDRTDFIKHAQYKLNDYTMMAMDSSAAHAFGFNDAISLVVECETQEEIDKYWDQLTSNGGFEVACGWCIDQFGISWQIIPKAIVQLISHPERGQRAMKAMMGMKKLIIKELENA
ncbi:VOC family protein [Pedobacter gandavensis]|uniref:VOC family protein n=1 Tax=Pedobacter gandavensis TaxID=2679963 RepID=A0ABR6EU77_9SPHI|nr:VOC family protein [Pedobacter gandavensis]MBB2148602.1 VOC family protein [Pedobacter gandavensis]